MSCLLHRAKGRLNCQLFLLHQILPGEEQQANQVGQEVIQDDHERAVVLTKNVLGLNLSTEDKEDDMVCSKPMELPISED